MNEKQKSAVNTGIWAFAAAILFPPYTIEYRGGVAIDSGFYFLLGDSPVMKGIAGKINAELLLLELVVIGVAVVAYVVANKG